MARTSTSKQTWRRALAGSALSLMMTAGAWASTTTPASALTNDQVLYLSRLCHKTGGTWVAIRHSDGTYSFRCEYGRSATSASSSGTTFAR